MIRRASLIVAVVAAAVLLVGGPASAHVTVSSSSATQGGYGKLTFRVPNEKPTASTVALEVNLPPDAPIGSVSVKPVPGWSAVVTKEPLATPITTGGRTITEAVTKIVWTAAPDAAVKPGQFQEFDVSAGPLPKVDRLVFKALQTYSDGDIVRWIEEPTAGSTPDHPAPTLALASSAVAASPAAFAADRGPGAAGFGVAIAVAALGLLIGLAGLIVAILALRRRPAADAAALLRRPAASA